MPNPLRCLVLFCALLVPLVTGISGAKEVRQRGKAMTLTLTSSAFQDHGAIPTRYTCDGADISLPLYWSDLPAGTKALALIVDDPDAPDPKAPTMTWIHWVLYDIPITATGLPEAITPRELPAGTREGTNSWKRTGYGGPCPPIGRHRYFCKLYALDTVLPDLAHPNARQLQEAMQGHIVAEAQLVGTYQR